VQPLACSDEEWGQALMALVSLKDVEPFKFQTWKEVASRYLDEVYRV